MGVLSEVGVLEYPLHTPLTPGKGSGVEVPVGGVRQNQRLESTKITEGQDVLDD